MCIFTQKPEFCEHPECKQFYAVFAASRFHFPTGEVVPGISEILEYQNTVLSSLYSNNLQLELLFDKVLNEAKILNSYLSNPRHSDLIIPESCNPSQAFSMLSWDLDYHLALESQLPENIYKERGFAISVSLRNRKDEICFLPTHSRYKVFLFTMDQQPRQLTLNISGKRIIRGTVEAEMQDTGIVNMTNIVINEVSSHYAKESFCLVIMSTSSSQVKPLLIKDLAVKARKMLKE
ncbi:unnamed protein product [Blepharisma stoltei]|uniref:Uncharacterized protein n=1 Tax=Blepharisma stoltei TaxID=1481888 RepID=A0AAU9JPM9_9CILI|nr:unnamed protein product [Blepharisma stoltei]